MTDVVLRHGAASCTIRPERGAIVTALALAGTPLLYLDEATLADPTKNVRGGIPVLFPTPGRLTADRWAWHGATGALPQHGLARQLPFAVVDQQPATATLRLLANAETRAAWPWDFTFDLVFSLAERALRITAIVTNHASTPMPFGLGFHPYFFARDADKPHAAVATAATRAFDNVTKTERVLPGPIDLTEREVDLHLLDHHSTESMLSLPDRRIVLRGSDEMTHWVVWTLAGRDFVCVEPWTMPGDGINRDDRVLVLPPGGTRTLWFDVALPDNA